MKSMDPLQEPYIRELHHRMFDNVWKWAGTYRKTERNIGCDPKEITQRIPQLLANTRFRLSNETFPVDEALLRFHHQLTKIHPFGNGNGRHARLIADIVAVKDGQSEFTWGAGKGLIAQGDARTHYLAALRALDANENDVKLLLDFARS
jgi:Fic-DOC domain mobile mystery protein B